MGDVYAVGVGPGAPEYITREAERVIGECSVVAGYAYTLETIDHLLGGKEVHRVTMGNQEETYRMISRTLGDRSLAVPFTGDVNFSESEVVDRLVEIFGDVVLVPGISSVQVASSRCRVPLDKSRVITMHVTSDIQAKKRRMVEALREGLSVILVPRPWPRRPDLNFMPSQVAAYLSDNGFNAGTLRVHVYENLTTPRERSFTGTLNQLEGRDFSDMVVMVMDQNRPDSYMNYRWQWDGGNPPEDDPEPNP